ncbi:Oxidored-FMN domain-containing protein [Mycena sanguinolenta]|uniref:Oxidored-FMN domain-containing protein n=1 Tax=Mycena sanguinolenta TaxID=230812 RepID=A0A8H6XE03_9AGAR|nr:Oxidored-FMN domain-containing protein [Mycena sanguinolenta]
MSVLFAPLDVGDFTIANRIGMSAMARNRADATRVPNHIMKKYYLQRALGGAGLIVTEATSISPHGSLYDRTPGIWSMEQVAGWKRITNVVHLAGSKIYCQLWHAGRLANSEGPLAGPFLPEQGKAVFLIFQSLSNTELRLTFKTHLQPTEIQDPAVFVDLYRDAARNAKLAGFDGVERELLHAANGFLVDQFLDSTSNVRTDKWGGSIENRARFGLEVLKALVEVFGSNVSVKVTPGRGYNDMKMPLEEDTVETFNYLLSEADKLRLSYITLSRYIPDLEDHKIGAGSSTTHDVLSAYTKLITNAKIFLDGGVTPKEAEELVKAGKVDGVFFGMSWLTHPDLAKRIRHGKRTENTAVIAHLYGDANVEPYLGYTDYPSVTY